MATVTEAETIAMSLPVAYVAPGEPLATAYARLDGWAQLHELLQTLDRRGTKPRLAYVYQMPETDLDSWRGTSRPRGNGPLNVGRQSARQ